MTRAVFRRLLGAACCIGALSAAAQPSATPHLPTPADFVALAQVGDPQISPDGTQIVYGVATPQGDGKPAHSQLKLIAATGKAAPRPLDGAGAANDAGAHWSADGRQVLFLSDRKLPDAGEAAKPAAMQVWRADADGRNAKALTRAAGDIAAFALSTDGAQLAYLATDPPSPAAQARIAAKDDAVEVGHPTLFKRLWVQDLATGQARVISPPNLQVQDVAWAPDGRTLALRVSDDTTLSGYWYQSRVVLLSLADGTLSAPLESLSSAFPLQFSPDGRKLLYGHIAPYGMVATVYAHDLASGKRVALAEDWPGTLWLARWQDDDTLIAQGLHGVRGEFLRVDANTGAWRTLARPQIAYPSFSTARSGRTAFIGLRDDQPAEVWTLDGGKLATRTDSNPQVAGWAHGQVRELAWNSSKDGRRITGVLITPPGWKAGTPLPTLVELHGGPGEAWWSGWMGSWHDWAQLLSTCGYAVFLPNPRGSEGQGHAFTELARHDWGGADFQDILDGVDMLEREGVIDPQRLGIGGWSYGGYMSAWAVTQSKRFKAAIVGAGVIDIGAMALTTDVPTYLPGYFGDPVTNRAEYDAHSPIRYVDKVSTPVLILHGEVDARVPLSQGQMFYRALKFHGTPVEMVTYPRGPHWFTEQAAGRDVQQRVLDWLQTHLQ
ncbi:Dipeptidyl aminopeptidase/acylaminoacyl peptidase [Pseudoxanthomonas sp. GM95]|uniref:S9 family peptidase n=1 Tax=Pseudoxanthomonas sp. GM95 TaxID=1881043 RepID=UPI0008AF24D8|nr:S9 family peptidase [Pseudoxanthomonas sp. GM95]SEM22718.1 Dipeptidyl aminopeptidase/acylaminoacyl peptidase [Pseudoxanthomonas sp. GM95]